MDYRAVSGYYKVLQRLTGGYRKPFFQLDRKQILFLGLFCIKIKVE